MKKEQKAIRYTDECRVDISTFIDGFKKHYVAKTFESAQSCVDFNWTDESFKNSSLQ